MNMILNSAIVDISELILDILLAWRICEVRFRHN